jgi:His/Glu/Gln/Arg/opine family amino acid ABC transporter permease subunit
MFRHGMGPEYLRLMADGLVKTLEISAGALVVGCIIGALLGALRGSSRVWVRAPVRVYVDLLRSLPLLILLFLVYYGLPILLGISVPVLVAAIVGQGLFAGAYITEVVHSGLRSTPRGQYEAARSLNLSYLKMMRHVIAPQALRVMTPAMVGLFVGNIKDSSIASIIGVTELTQTALNIRSLTYSTWDVFGFLIAFYLVVNFSVTFAGGRLERRLDITIPRHRPNRFGIHTGLARRSA